MTQTKSIFQQPLWVTIFALTAAIAWGWAYPLIKLGFSEFAISADMTGSKMLFAGIRFCLSGLIILAIAGTKKRDFKVRKPIDWWYILLFCMMNTTLHMPSSTLDYHIVKVHEQPFSTRLVSFLSLSLLVSSSRATA